MLRDRRTLALLLAVVATSALAACGSGGSGASGDSPSARRAAAPVAEVGPSAATPTTPTTPTTPSPTPTATRGATATPTPSGSTARTPARRRTARPAARPAAGTAHADHVVGHGSPAGCTSAAVVKAVAAGGVIGFDCGPKPVTITMATTAKVVNAHPDVVLDGGGRVTLSGGGKRRILYLNTCDQAQGWTTSHCNDQAHPALTLQHITFADGNSTGSTTDGGGGGAVFARGGRLRVLDARFVRNRCDRTGPDLGGAAIRVLDQAGGRPVTVSGSTFEYGSCSNGGALSSIGVSWAVSDSVFRHNAAVGRGANPARSGSPGGGSGGAIYTDGNTYTVALSGTRIEDNSAAEGGGAIFYVSNDHSGSLTIRGSTLRSNPNAGFSTKGYPGIFYLGRGTHPTVSGSTLRP